MTRHALDPDTLQTVLTLATRAPSIHNSQPWRWRVAAHDELRLYRDPALQLLRTDPDGRDLLVSCGATLHHCVVALAALGWRATVQRLPDPADPDLLATLRVGPGQRPPADTDSTLAAAIARRRTDRRHYSSRPVPAADIALMGARAARLGVMLRRFDTLDALTVVVAHAVTRHLVDHDYLAELATWSGRYGSLAGVPARSTPAADSAATLPGRLFAGPALAQPPHASAGADHGVFVALGTAADDRLARLRAGEATSVVLLTATALGLASCPVTEPLEIDDTRAAVRADVFGTSGYPQMMLRIGWAPTDADPLPATPRRQLADVVAWTS
ncbi:NAD(P)H nitroreductase [Mycobacterium sp. pUA109]|uniref:Acg family FMN-binding oxidoreductase n=1 Tax=Mycobacterium sp. pUA109 TaxID=3238982 RepID=UPI00351BBB89